MGLLHKSQLIYYGHLFLTFIRYQFGYADIIYDQFCNSSFHETLESIQYNNCLAITGGMTKHNKYFNTKRRPRWRSRIS